MKNTVLLSLLIVLIKTSSLTIKVCEKENVGNKNKYLLHIASLCK